MNDEIFLSLFLWILHRKTQINFDLKKPTTELNDELD